MHNPSNVFRAFSVLQTGNNRTSLRFVFVLRSASSTQANRVMTVEKRGQLAMKALVLQPRCEIERHIIPLSPISAGIPQRLSQGKLLSDMGAISLQQY